MIETYAYGMSKNQVSKKEEIKYINIIKQYKKWLTLMILQKKKHNPNWPQLPDHPYRILIIGGFRSGKTNSFI